MSSILSHSEWEILFFYVLSLGLSVDRWGEVAKELFHSVYRLIIKEIVARLLERTAPYQNVKHIKLDAVSGKNFNFSYLGKK